jgi:hypothetical protein
MHVPGLHVRLQQHVRPWRSSARGQQAVCSQQGTSLLLPHIASRLLTLYFAYLVTHSGRPFAYLFGRPRYCQPVNSVYIFHIAFFLLRLTSLNSGFAEVQILNGYAGTAACTFIYT